MEYIFRIDQIEILNRLIFDASIDLVDIEQLKLVDSSLEFEIERRAFENVTRQKKTFWTVTYLSGMTSKIRFENVNQLSVSGLKEEFKHNHFIAGITIKKDGSLIVETVYGLIIKMEISEKTVIYLKDIRESKFGKGKVGGKSGFTSDEWTAFLKEKNYIETEQT
ncbi:MAG: hypothetical protein V4547_04480 [Bacteroidota bacterium]